MAYEAMFATDSLFIVLRAGFVVCSGPSDSKQLGHVQQYSQLLFIWRTDS
jgi:hypothetical protein